MNFIAHLTAQINGVNLTAMLKKLGEAKAQGKKGEQAERIYRIWMEEPKRLLDQLTEEQKLVLAECAYGNRSKPDFLQINAKHNINFTLSIEIGYQDAPFILCFFWRDDDWSYRLVDDVSDRLKEVLPPPPALEIDSLSAESVRPIQRSEYTLGMDNRALHVYESEKVALVEARRMLQLAAAGKLRVSDSTGFPPESTQKVVGGILAAPEMDLACGEKGRPYMRKEDLAVGPIRAWAWPVLLPQCGWAKAKAGKLVLTRAGQSLLENFTPEGYAEGVAAFIADEQVDEMRRVTVIMGQSGRSAARCRIPVVLRRVAITRMLRELPKDRWVAVAEAYRVISALGGDGRVVTESNSLYIGDLHYGSLYGSEHGLGRIYLRQLAGASLVTLGLLDVSYVYPHFLCPDVEEVANASAYATPFDGMKHLRVTALGRFCLGGEASYVAPVAEARTLFRVLPNHDVVVTDAAAFSLADAAMIERFAGKVSDHVWKIERTSILAALEEGDSPEHLLAVLAEGSGAGVPEPVRLLIEETAARAKAATAKEEAVIVTFRDEATAALVASDPVARKVGLIREGDAVVVPANRLKAFRAALRALGILLPA